MTVFRPRVEVQHQASEVDGQAKVGTVKRQTHRPGRRRPAQGHRGAGDSGCTIRRSASHRAGPGTGTSSRRDAPARGALIVRSGHHEFGVPLDFPDVDLSPEFGSSRIAPLVSLSRPGCPARAPGRGRVRRAGGSVSRGGSGRAVARRVRATGLAATGAAGRLAHEGQIRGRARAHVGAAMRRDQRPDPRAAPSRYRKRPTAVDAGLATPAGREGKGGGGGSAGGPPREPAVPPSGGDRPIEPGQRLAGRGRRPNGENGLEQRPSPERRPHGPV